ncbi:hypothetical protein SCP_1801410 [Sparassis crispa]|uniref:Fungal-type protein kinase domain-containing protein n=1 Tax=Sparassis crispa TaxID=139825 RepID=A0A401H6Q2_9APHY|nr:hypothetical protein SCP_1801410 [Sparassis crispa]GBE90117.1 hypothetical protein SCP_1801410 [Sparassis crispa]
MTSSRKPGLRRQSASLAQTRQYRAIDDYFHRFSFHTDVPTIAPDLTKVRNKRKPPRVNDEDWKSAWYNWLMMSHNIRSYTSGFTVDGLDVTLWYADRMGLVYSSPFNFLQQPHLLLLVIAALGSADLSTLGVSPYLEFPSRTFQAWHGATIVVPDGHARDIDNRALEQLVFNVDICRKLSMQSGILCKGTAVLPIMAIGTAAQKFGRDELVVKAAWPFGAVSSEHRLIRMLTRGLRRQKPDFLKHVVELKCSVNRSLKELNLPRIFIHGPPIWKSSNSPVFRMQIMKKYERLQCIECVDEFKTVFVDVVRGEQSLTNPLYLLTSCRSTSLGLGDIEGAPS